MFLLLLRRSWSSSTTSCPLSVPLCGEQVNFVEKVDSEKAEIAGEMPQSDRCYSAMCYSKPVFLLHWESVTSW
eukprot:scaffold14816_cov89-Skeletonema_marinoi.AAC.2